MKLVYFSILTLACLCLASTESKAVDFESEIQPILKEHCAKCHSGPKAKRKIDYLKPKVLQGLMGTEEHHIINPGHPEKSMMLKLAALPRDDTKAMPPPKRGKPLNLAQIALIRKWISEGAKLEKSDSAADKSTASETTTESDAKKVYDWTSVTGSKIKASFVSLEDGAVTLHRIEGNRITVPIEKLAKDSQELIKKLAQ